MTLTQQPYNGVQIAAPYCNRATKQISEKEKAAIIKKIVCDFYNIPTFIIESKTRKREIVEPRHVAMVLMRKFTKLGVKNVGIEFGGRHWSTVIHGTQMVSDLCYTDKLFKNNYTAIETKIKLELLS